MRTVDLSSYFVIYNFVIGVLIVLSSEQLGVYAGLLNRSYSQRLTSLTRLATRTFGCTVAFLSGFIFIAFHLLRIGV